MTPTHTATAKDSWFMIVGQTALIAVVFVFVARVWAINQHIVFVVIVAVLMGVIAWRPPKGLHHSVLDYLPLGLMGIVFVIMASSSLWAPEFLRTFSYSVFSFLHFLIGVAVALAFPVARIVAGIVVGVAGVALYGLILGFVDLDRGVTTGLVMGEFTNQSELSHFLGVGLILALAVGGRSGGVMVSTGLMVGGLVVYLVYLGYLTSFVAVAAGLWVYLVTAVIRRLGPHLRVRGVVVVAIVTTVLLAVAWVLRVPLQVMAGKTPDFSGRIPFWEHFWSVALANPWGGLGWGWLTWAPPGREPPVPVQEYFPAHQGYIEFAYMLGIPAMVLVIVVLALLLGASFWKATGSDQGVLSSAVPALVAYLSVFDLAATFHTRTIGMFFLGLLVVLASGLVRNVRVSSPR